MNINILTAKAGESDVAKIGNSMFMLIACSIVIIFVAIQAILFYKKAYGRGVEIGMTKDNMSKVTRNSAIFSIIPAIPILLFLILLAPGLGNYFPWLRLSVIGSGVYENLIANTVSGGAGFTALTDIDMETFIVIMFTMTFAIMASPILTVVVLKPFSNKISEFEANEGGFGPHLVPTLFIALFLSLAIPSILPMMKDVPVDIAKPDGEMIRKLVIPTLPIIAMGSAALCVIVLGKVNEKVKSAVLQDFSFPLSIFVGMIAVIIASALGVS